MRGLAHEWKGQTKLTWGQLRGEHIHARRHPSTCPCVQLLSLGAGPLPVSHKDFLHCPQIGGCKATEGGPLVPSLLPGLSGSGSCFRSLNEPLFEKIILGYSNLMTGVLNT